MIENKEVKKYEGPLIKRKNEREQTGKGVMKGKDSKEKESINLSTKSTTRSSQQQIWMGSEKNIVNDV